jgi:hypothetical protein
MEDEIVQPAQSDNDGVVAEQEVTVTPDSENIKPVVKTFTQEEFNAQIGERLARERRKWKREQNAPKPTDIPSVKMSPENFANAEEYAQAYAKALVEERENSTRIFKLVDEYKEREESVRDKYGDYDTVVTSPQFMITDTMAETIVLSESGPDITYYLASNPSENTRISKLPPLAQAKEIGKIEMSLKSTPVVKKVSAAPTPISTVKANSGTPVYDTTDPRSVKFMTTEEWVAAERKRRYNNMQR